MTTKRMSDEELLELLENGEYESQQIAADRIRELLTALSALRSGSECEIVRHKARGSQYFVLGVDGVLQSSKGSISEGERLTSYMDGENRLWHRPSDEFRDGRYEIIKKEKDVTSVVDE